jgi:hypothetical protein
MFSPPTSQSTQQHVNLLKYIPQSVTGSVLVTSRNMGSAIKLVGDKKAIIPINSMDPSEALSLLNNKLTDKQQPVAIGLTQTKRWKPMLSRLWRDRRLFSKGKA